MQIILEEHEIKAALVAYANSIVQVKDDQEISIDMKAGRGDNGYTATLSIQPKPQPVATGTKPRAAIKPTAVETTQAAEPKPVAKTGLFTKPTIVADAPKEETQATEPEVAEEPKAGISTGEDRGEQEETLASNVDLPEEPAAEPEVAEAPAEKPKSIFNFAKPAANG